MKINVEFDSIKEMDEWIGRMGQPSHVQQHYSLANAEESITDPTQEAKEEKPKATRKRKASKPKVVKDEPKVEEKEEAPQVPSTESPYIEDEKEADVPTEQEAHEQQVEPEETEEAPSQPAPTETTGTPISIKSNPELVGFLQSIFGGAGNDNVKQALTTYDGGLPQYIADHLDDYSTITTRESALEVLKSSLGV